MRIINVLVVGKNPDSSLFRHAPLEKAGCQCHFVESREEIGELFSHTKLDIVLTIGARSDLSALMSLFAGSTVSMFYRLPVEEGSWWLPVLRRGQDCLGAAAFRTKEFSQVFAELVRTIAEDSAVSA